MSLAGARRRRHARGRAGLRARRPTGPGLLSCARRRPPSRQGPRRTGVQLDDARVDPTLFVARGGLASRCGSSAGSASSAVGGLRRARREPPLYGGSRATASRRRCSSRTSPSPFGPSWASTPYARGSGAAVRHVARAIGAALVALVVALLGCTLDAPCRARRVRQFQTLGAGADAARRSPRRAGGARSPLVVGAAPGERRAQPDRPDGEAAGRRSRPGTARVFLGQSRPHARAAHQRRVHGHDRRDPAVGRLQIVGFNEDDVRAEAVRSSGWTQTLAIDWDDGADVRASARRGHAPSGQRCHAVRASAACTRSFGSTSKSAWPMWSADSTPFHVDYVLQPRRACFEGWGTGQIG